MGPFRVESLSGFRFCIVFANQYTKFLFVDLLKVKSEELASLKKFVLSVGTPKKLRQDNAKEFLSEQFKMYCLDSGILQKTIQETPHQNGLAEGCNRTLLEMASCLLVDSGLPKMMWGAAILHATRIRNLVVRREEKCPVELMRGIGSGTEMSANLNPRHWKESLWVTLKETTDGWCSYPIHARLWQFELLSSRSPKWAQSLTTQTPDLLDEGSQQLGIWYPDDGHQDDGNKDEQGRSTAIKEEWHEAGSVNTQETTLRQEASDVGETAVDEGSTATRGTHRDSDSLEDSDTEDFSQLETVGFNEDALEHADRADPRRGPRARNVPQFFGEVRTHLAVTEGDYVEPETVYEAKQGDDWDQWHRAMKDEVKALQDNETWNLVRPPTDRDVIPGKWVYKVKVEPSGQVDKYKARYVAKGFKQVEGLDYFETFAPTCKPETFRILLQLSAKQGHVMHQFDVKTAFLHSPIEEEVYLEKLEEFVKQGSDGKKLVC